MDCLIVGKSFQQSRGCIPSDAMKFQKTDIKPALQQILELTIKCIQLWILAFQGN